MKINEIIKAQATKKNKTRRKGVNVGIYFRIEEFEFLQKYAQFHDFTINDVIRQALSRYLKFQEKNDQ